MEVSEDGWQNIHKKTRENIEKPRGQSRVGVSMDIKTSNILPDPNIYQMFSFCLILGSSLILTGHKLSHMEQNQPLLSALDSWAAFLDVLWISKSIINIVFKKNA